MKRFKNSFGVTGTPAQIQAFKEYAESIGWRFSHDNWSSTNLYFASHNDISFGASRNSFWYPKTLAGDAQTTTYRLPSQWAEAMQAASEVVKEPVITKVYRNVYGNNSTVNIKGICQFKCPTLERAMSDQKCCNPIHPSHILGGDTALCVIEETTIDGVTTDKIVHVYTSPVTL